MSADRTKSGPTPKRDAQRRKSTARRRADLSGTAPWAFRVPTAPVASGPASPRTAAQ